MQAPLYLTVGSHKSAVIIAYASVDIDTPALTVAHAGVGEVAACQRYRRVNWECTDDGLTETPHELTHASVIAGGARTNVGCHAGTSRRAYGAGIGARNSIAVPLLTRCAVVVVPARAVVRRDAYSLVDASA